MSTLAAGALSDPLTVREFRGDHLTAGPVGELLRMMPSVVYVAVEKPETDGEDTGVAPTLPAPEKVYVKVSDRDVERARAFIASTGIVEFLDAAHATTRIKQGRKALLSTRAVLVAMQLLVTLQRPLLLTEVRDILFCSISPAMRRVLDDVPDRPAPPVTDKKAHRRWDDATQGLVRRAFHRMLAPVDPSVLPKNRVISTTEAERLKRDLSIEEQQARAVALDWVCNQLVEAAYRQLPEKVRERHANNAAYCIDATPLPLFARGKGLNKTTISSDPDGGWYQRDGDHSDPNETPGRFVRTTAKFIYARDVHLIVTADASHPERQYMPALPLALTTDRPGVDPAGAARRLFANLANREHAPGPLAGDILYTNQAASLFQTPAREAGYDLVLGYGKNQAGKQEGHASGMQLVDGQYYAPCMPDDLVDLTAMLREKTITLAEFKKRIQRRVAYRMRTKSKAKPGFNERLSCPASGPVPLVKCALKPESLEDRPVRHAGGVKLDLRRPIKHKKVLTNGEAPKVCTQNAVSVKPTDGAKFRQSLAYGSDEHTALYHRLRQSQEGVHGSAKNEASVALANPGRRRVRGWAAQQLFAAFLLARTATERIKTFLRDAIPDDHGHLYVPRAIPLVDGEPALTSGAPPGSHLGDDTEDE